MKITDVNERIAQKVTQCCGKLEACAVRGDTLLETCQSAAL